MTETETEARTQIKFTIQLGRPPARRQSTCWPPINHSQNRVQCTFKKPSNLGDLGRGNQRVLPRDQLAPGGLVVEAAGVCVGVAACAAVGAPAPAREPEQPHLPLARLAPALRRRRRHHQLLLLLLTSGGEGGTLGSRSRVLDRVRREAAGRDLVHRGCVGGGGGVQLFPVALGA